MTETKTNWYVKVPEAGNEQFAEFLSKIGEGSGREVSILKVDGIPHPCWSINAWMIDHLEAMKKAKPEFFKGIRFIRVRGGGKPKFADFFGRGQSASKVRKTFRGVALQALKVAQTRKKKSGAP